MAETEEKVAELRDELAEANAVLGKALKAFAYAAETHGIDSKEYVKARDAVHAAQEVANKIARDKKTANLARNGEALRASLAAAEKDGDDVMVQHCTEQLARLAVAQADHVTRNGGAA